MKNTLIQTVWLAIISIPVFAFVSDNEMIKYFNERMEPVKSKKDAAYYAELIGQYEGKHTFKVKYLSGEVKMEGTYLDADMKLPHGEFTYYYASGKVESQGEYRDGYKYGIWQRYDPGGNEKPEKIYAAGAMLKYMNAEAQR